MEQTIEPANIAGKLGLADIVKHAHERDAEFVGAYFEQHWSFISGNSAAMASLMREMKRRFKLRDRKKQLDGTYKTIRGFTSFEKWFVFATGKSVRSAYNALRTEERKHNKNARKALSTDDDFVDACLGRIEKVLKSLKGEPRHGEILQTLAEKLQR